MGISKPSQGLTKHQKDMAVLSFSLIQRYQHYLAMRAHYYQQEKRFLNSPFWQKMQAMSPHKIHSEMELQANLT
ncbi:hypothetical protein OLL83_002519 [Shewanella algae]|uniref:hypothetical protein n=1 Tax=Shewanella algae TaxID=38313 RepID=UPI00222FC1A1|nr:hypothetical protein [Shewanella algae]UZD56821.1 hypothetical protein OLL83_002519 [Shewanella algae]